MFVRMYLFAILRQAGLVLLEAGLNGGLSKQWQGQATTPGATFPTLWEKSVGSFKSPANQYRGDAEDGT